MNAVVVHDDLRSGSDKCLLEFDDHNGGDVGVDRFVESMNQTHSTCL